MHKAKFALLGLLLSSVASWGQPLGVDSPVVLGPAPPYVASGTPCSGDFCAATAPLSGALGGTGVANTGKTITLGGNLTTNGALTINGTSSPTVDVGTGGTIGAVGYSATGQIQATATNDNAASGKVGEYQESVVACSSPVAVTSGNAANLANIAIGAGDWDVSALMNTLPGAGTTTSQFVGAVTSVNATLPNDEYRMYQNYSAAANAIVSISYPARRFSVSGTTTIYAVVRASFAVSTLGVCGWLRARRVR